MRRTPPSDMLTPTPAEGATSNPGFERAFRELAEARAVYDAALGDPERVPDLAHAAARLDSARRAIRSLDRAA